MNKLIKLGLVPFVALMACGDGDSGKNTDAGARKDGAASSAKDGSASEVAADAGVGAPDSAILPTVDALIAVDVQGPDGAQAGDAAPPDAGASLSDAAVAISDAAGPDVVPSDTAVAADATVKLDTTIVPAVDAGVDLAPADAAMDSPSPDATVAVDTLVQVDTLVAVDTTPAVDTTAVGDTTPTNSDTSLLVPFLASVSPTVGDVGQVLSLTLVGTDFESSSVVYFDGQGVATTVVSATSITAQVPANLATQAGLHVVTVESASDHKSNPLYVTLEGNGALPEIIDYSPDNGLPGDTITLVGLHLDGALTIKGPGDLSATNVGTVTTGKWLESSSAMQKVTFVLANGWQTGPIVVTNTAGSSRGKVFYVGRNLTTLPGVTVAASSEYSSSYAKGRAVDNDLGTSWFTADYNCATDPGCTSEPWIVVSFPTAQTVSRIAIRGNREYDVGYDFLRGRIDILGAGGTLWSKSYDLPGPVRDLDITLPAPIGNVVGVKFTGLADEDIEPGLSELEVF